MEKLFNNIDIFEKICEHLSIYNLFKIREVCKVIKNIIMNMERFIHFNSTIKFSKAIGDDETGKVIYYYMNDKYTSRGWAFGNLLNFVIGQGEVITTPLQIVQLMNIISTDGNAKSPHLILNHKSENLYVELKPKTWSFLKKALYDVVNIDGGTGYNAKIIDGGLFLI